RGRLDRIGAALIPLIPWDREAIRLFLFHLDPEIAHHGQRHGHVWPGDKVAVDINGDVVTSQGSGHKEPAEKLAAEIALNSHLTANQSVGLDHNWRKTI